MPGGQAQREAALALKDTFGKAADDISSKAGDFHDLTADAALKNGQNLSDLDGDLGKGFDQTGGKPPEAPEANPGAGGGAPEGSGGPGDSDGPVDDDFHGGGQDPEGNDGATTAGDPVDVVSGQLLSARTDLALTGQLPLILRRAYASGYRHGRLLGAGWSSTLDQRVVIEAEGIRFFGDDAQTLRFPRPSRPGQRVLPEYGARWELTWDESTGDIRIEDPDQGCTRLFTTVGATRSGSREVRPITALANRNGHRIVYVRDTEGLPTEVRHSGGHRVAVDTVYTPAGFRLEALRYLDGTDNGRGAVIQAYEYDQRGRLIAVTDSSGVPFLYEYDGADRISARTDRNGFRYAYEYDDESRVVRGVGDGGVLSASFEYGEARRVTKVVNSVGDSVEYHYDENSHIRKTVDALGNADVAEHDRYGRLLSSTDALGNTTRYTREEHGWTTRVDRPDHTAVTYAYAEIGRVGEIVWPDGTRWGFAYDERGNMLSATGPDGPVGTFAYDERGCLVSSSDVLDRTVRIEPTGTGLPLRELDFDGRATTHKRDVYGRIIETVRADGSIVRAGWTPQGQIAWRELPGTGREEYEYDPEGNLVRLSTDQGVATFEYGPFSTVTARTSPSGERLRFTYDTECRLVSVTDSRDLSWTYEWDAAGRIVSETDYDGRTLTYHYDAANRLVERVNAEGRCVRYVRDSLGRTRELTDDDGGRTTYELDVNGRLLRAVSGGSELAYTYDRLGRVLSESVDGAVVSSEFDAAGRRLRRTTPSDVVSEWTYDLHSRPLSLAAGGGSLTFAYDDRGREAHRYLGPAAALSTTWTDEGLLAGQHIWANQPPEQVPEGSNPYALVSQRTFEYDQFGRLSRIGDQSAGAREFTYEAGRVVRVQAASWTESYLYNNAGDLTQAVFEQVGAEEVPPVVPNEFSGSRLVAGRGETYEYDRQGRVVRRTQRTISGRRRSWSYTWDCRDRLTLVAQPDSTTWRYDYDPIGRRVGKTHLDADGAELSATRFVWDGRQLAEEAVVTGGLRTTRTWDYEPDTFRPATQVEQRTAPIGTELSDAEVDLRFYAIVADAVGTPRELVSGEGRIVWRADTDLWGTRLATVGEPDTACPLGFPGQYHDEETGWLYNHYRYYDPKAARYVSPDPLGLVAGANHYKYVDDPMVWVDPLGLAPYRTLPTDHPRILNIGAGKNPMDNAYNIDLDPGEDNPDVIAMDATRMQGIPDNYFDVVHAINPYGFQVVSPETARVMAPEAKLNVSGNVKANKWVKPSKITPEVLEDAGLEKVTPEPIAPIAEHRFGTQALSDGTPIQGLDNFKTQIYQKPGGAGAAQS